MKKISRGLLAFAVMASALVVWVRELWPVAISEVFGFGLAAIWLVRLAAGKEDFRSSRGFWPAAGIVVWGLFQLVAGTTVYAWKTESGLLYWAACAAFFFSAVQTFGDHRLRRGFLLALVVFGVALAIVSTAQYYTASSQIFWVFTSPIDLGAIMGPFLNRNHYCAFMELLLPIAMYRALTDERYAPWYAVVTGTIYASIVASASRGGAVLGTAELVAVPLLLAAQGTIRFRQAAPALGALALSIGGLVLAAGYDNVIGRLGQDDPYSGRREFLLSSVDMAKDHPWTGVGLGNWPTVYPRYALFDDGLFANATHNDWAQWLTEGGVPMLLLLLGLAVWAFPRAVRSVWGIGVIAILLHSAVDFSLQRMPIAILFFVMLGLLEFEGYSKARRTGLQ